MDRNFCVVSLDYKEVVALRKESVDRNPSCIRRCLMSAVSLSARRAWIEIGSAISESRYRRTSLSARRAWIEMTQCRL